MDIWFGPGGTQGAFGAGIATGLHDALSKGDIKPDSLRLYGSSVGCLTAIYLATGNTDFGLQIFKDDASSIMASRNLLPMIAASTINRMGTAVGRNNTLLSVPSVLKVEQAMAVMLRYTPDIAHQLRTARVPVYAELVDRQTSQYRHVDLRTADDPIRWIRASINHVPFASGSDDQFVDSNIKGYGFYQLPEHDRNRGLVVVFNQAPSRDLAARICGRICAVLCRTSDVAKLYAQRHTQFGHAMDWLNTKSENLLVVVRPNSCRSVDKAYAEGFDVSKRVVEFLCESAGTQSKITGC